MKIKLIAKKHQQISFLQSEKFQNLCTDHNITFVNKNEDILLVHTDAVNIRKNPNILNNQPTIIIERYDSSNIGHVKELNSKSLLALWKSSKFRKNETNFLPRYKGRYHSLLIMNNRPDKDNELIKKVKNLDESNLYKVDVLTGYAHYSSVKSILNTKNDINKTRTIDVQFLGTTMYDATESGSPISIHRMTCLRKLKTLSKFKTLIKQGKPLSHSQYSDSLYSSKIVISPWGCGEICYRDFEALAAGCILLKPDSSFVQTWPDIFINNKTYVPCNCDFSDVEEKIKIILKNWNNYHDMRESNRKLIEKSVTIPDLVDRFVLLLNKLK